MRNTSEDRRRKLVDGALRVHVWTPTGFLSAGLLTLEEDGEQISATFRYDQSYLDDGRAFALDPLNLPLGQTLYASTSQYVRLGGIFDAAPDAWGRKVVAAQLPEDARQRVFRGAFLRGADGIGAMVITPDALNSQLELDKIVALSLSERPGVSQLANAAHAAREFEAGMDLTEEMRQMLGGSWTIGGARPKAILRNDTAGAAPGESVIAKFQSKNDTVSRNRLEYASLQMATDMGFPVPKHFLAELSAEGETALVLHRFDRDVSAGGGQVQRRHYLSAMSLASYQPQSKFLNSTMDQAVLSWSRLLDLTSRICEHPSSARVQMFARLCLNAALQNTDDHLKNFGFLKASSSAVRYEIAPVFDVSPQAAQRHYLHCGNLGQTYTLDDVLAQAKKLGIARSAATDIEDRLLSVLSRRAEYFEAAGMSRADSLKANEWVEAGLGPRYAQERLADASVLRPSDH